MKNICSAPIVSVDYLEKERTRLDKVVLVGGGFDVLHEGHIRHLQKAKSLGNILIVHITGDKRIKEKKGPERPVFPELRRAAVISTIKFVDYVFVYNGRHYDQKIIDKLKPDILFF
ncbi:MAG: adenylyltransferase/cytidyltransferase family protein, partial [bacterium]|nr:adenylyltransferase/cytidyltransferase family protein [bacterium]